MNFKTINVKYQSPICYVQIHRPEANNTINDVLVEECLDLLGQCESRKGEEEITLVVWEGLPEVFCFGADFQAMSHNRIANGPERLYELWLKMATGPFVTISHVRGKVNAGGVGFVAASDIVLSDDTAQFSLSELLFGLFPACVLPFLIRRIGFQKAHYLTLMTQPIEIKEALRIGLVDVYDEQSESLLRKHLLRLRRLNKAGIARYKRYLNQIDPSLSELKDLAVSANLEIFSDPANIKGIVDFVQKGIFPWQKD